MGHGRGGMRAGSGAGPAGLARGRLLRHKLLNGCGCCCYSFCFGFCFCLCFCLSLCCCWCHCRRRRRSSMHLLLVMLPHANLPEELPPPPGVADGVRAWRGRAVGVPGPAAE